MKNTLRILVSLLALFFLPLYVFASSFSFEAPRKNLLPGDSVEVTAFLEPGGESVNAVDGIIEFPLGLEVVSLETGNSLLSPFIEAPMIKGNTLIFSGIIPNGYQGPSRTLLTFVVKVKEGGLKKIKLSGTVLKNDGKGTALTMSPASLELTVGKGNGGTTYLKVREKDTEPPETFVPTIGTSTDLFAGAPFISFETQDKNSGVTGYLMAKASPRFFFFTPLTPTVWSPVESPYVLEKRDLQKFIFIKATDTQDNERVAVVAPESGFYQQRGTLLWGILIGVTLYVIIKIIRRKKASLL